MSIVLPCVIRASAEQYRIYATQLLGSPLYFYDKNLFYAYMAMTKQSFGILVTTITQWWTPTVVRISGDASVAGQLQVTPDGRVECRFPDRVVLIANHQVRSRPEIMNDTKYSSYTLTGYISGGLRTRTSPECMATFSSF